MFSLKTLWRVLFRKRELEQNLSDELASYADMLTDEKVSRGIHPAMARRQSLMEIGGMEQVKEDVRDIRIGAAFDSLFKDLQLAVRSLRQSAGSSLLAIATLALGLGATTLIFSVVYSALLQPLPFKDPEQLVRLWETRTGQGWDQAAFSVPNFWDVRAQNRTFESMAAFQNSDMNLTGNGDPQHVSGASVSAQFFHVLGVAPVIGRDFSADQDRPERDNSLVLLSNKFWKHHFASRKDIVGTTLQLSGRPYSIVGVLPDGEPWLDEAEVFIPLVFGQGGSRGGFEASVIGRLKPGVSIAEAHADLQRVAHNLSRIYREDRTMGIRIGPSAAWGARPIVRRALWVLLAAVGFLLLIACVNIANLLLAKASARSRELRVREALGASRYRILRFVLTESLLLSILGAALGLLIAFWGLHFIRASQLDGIPHLSEVGINCWVLSFTLLATVLATIVSGLVPALRSSAGNIAVVLREGDRAQTSGRIETRLRSLLVAAEVALSLILLIGASLFLRSFSKILTVDRGFQTANRVIATVNLPSNYDDRRAEAITRTLLDRVRAVPGIQAAGTVNSKPIVGWDPGMGFGAADSALDATHPVPWASWRFVSTGYFDALGIRLLRGSRFIDTDYHSAKRHVVISESIATVLWPNQNPIGRRMSLWKGQSNRVAEVVGVVADMRDHGLDAAPTRTVYLLFNGQTNSPVQLIVQTALSPGQLADFLRPILASVDPKVPVLDVERLDELVNRTLGSKRFNTVLLSVFAVVALLLSVSGIYGVLAYSVARRTSEIGIRIALGADGKTILRLLMQQGMRPIVLGIAVGVAASLALSRLLAGLLFEVKPADPVSYLAVILIVLVTALIACFLPARRAMRIDPVAAMRES